MWNQETEDMLISLVQKTFQTFFSRPLKYKLFSYHFQLSVNFLIRLEDNYPPPPIANFKCPPLLNNDQNFGIVVLLILVKRSNSYTSRDAMPPSQIPGKGFKLLNLPIVYRAEFIIRRRGNIWFWVYPKRLRVLSLNYGGCWMVCYAKSKGTTIQFIK